MGKAKVKDTPASFSSSNVTTEEVGRRKTEDGTLFPSDQYQRAVAAVMLFLSLQGARPQHMKDAPPPSRQSRAAAFGFLD